MEICGNVLDNLAKRNNSGGLFGSPTVGIADAEGSVPGDGDGLAVALLDPGGAVVVEVNDRSDGDAAVEAVLDFGVAGVAGDAALQPGVAGDDLRSGEAEVFHHSGGLGVLAEGGMQPAVGSGVLVGVAEGEFVGDGVSKE